MVKEQKSDLPNEHRLEEQERAGSWLPPHLQICLLSSILCVARPNAPLHQTYKPTEGIGDEDIQDD